MQNIIPSCSELKAGEEKEISFAITPDTLQILSSEMKWGVEPGYLRRVGHTSTTSDFAFTPKPCGILIEAAKHSGIVIEDDANKRWESGPGH